MAVLRLALLSIWVPNCADAQIVRPDMSARRLMLFNIPAGPLHHALESFSAVTGTALIYDSALADRRQSRPVVGLFTAEVALRMMLAGSDLTIRYNSPTDIMRAALAKSESGRTEASFRGTAHPDDREEVTA